MDINSAQCFGDMLNADNRLLETANISEVAKGSCLLAQVEDMCARHSPY